MDYKNQQNIHCQIYGRKLINTENTSFLGGND